MKIPHLKTELFFVVVGVLSVLSPVLHFMKDHAAQAPRIAGSTVVQQVYVDTLVENDGGEGLVSVWIEQDGVKRCETMTFLTRGETRKVTVVCPGLAPKPFRVLAAAR